MAGRGWGGSPPADEADARDRIVRATADSEAGAPPDPRLMAEMADYHEALARAGVLLDAAGLKPSGEGWRVQYRAGQRHVVDGPFAETREQLGGYFLIEAADRDAALAVAARIPGARWGTVEVRPVIEIAGLPGR